MHEGQGAQGRIYRGEWERIQAEKAEVARLKRSGWHANGWKRLGYQRSACDNGNWSSKSAVTKINTGAQKRNAGNKSIPSALFCAGASGIAVGQEREVCSSQGERTIRLLEILASAKL
jgi:hypothetical protein